MKYTLLIINLFALFSFGQNGKFPESWIGDYQGKMILAGSRRSNDTIPVDFSFTELVEDSVWTYTMTYYSDVYGEFQKDYLIRSASKGDTVNFELDEQNGIIMELTLMKNCFYGMYAVLDDIYSTTLRLHEGGIFFELYAVSSKEPRISKLTDETKDITATSYKPKLVQSAYLKRK